MSTARHLIALLRTHVQGDEHEFLSVAMELAAREAHSGMHELPNKSASLLIKLAPEPRKSRNAAALLLFSNREGRSPISFPSTNPRFDSPVWCCPKP